MAITRARGVGDPNSLQWLVDAYMKNNPNVNVDPNQQGTAMFSMNQINPTDPQLGQPAVKPAPSGRFAFETKQPTYGSSDGGSNLDLTNMGAQSLKYVVPAARLLSNDRKINDLRTKSQLNLDKVQLFHGTVRDLQRPNFGMRYRDPAGSSLQELIGGQKFADAQQRDAEREWQMQNSTSRIQQQQQINQIANQEALTNAQITNAGKQYNANIANNERFMRMNNQEELELGLTETAQNDINQKNYLDATKEASAAGDILRYGQPGTPEYNSALQYYMGVVNRNKAQTFPKEFGGKLKRKTKLSYA